MKYTSTRDASKLYTFEEALCSGYAPDGGLFVPETLPRQIDASTLMTWSQLSYVDLASDVISRFVDDIPTHDLKTICQKAYSGFTDERIVPVVQLSPKLHVVELFHGPTFCFKDLGMRAVIQLLNYYATRKQTQVTLVVSTTGDTGPAAVQAVQDAASPYLSILVHYPKGQISDFQRKQLTTADSSRVKVVSFEGGGDDMDVPIKNIMTSSSTSPSEKNRLICGVNSYNIGRPLMQMAHFIWTYLRVVESLGKEPGDPNFVLDIVLPTGAMGNIAGGYMAKKMGLPLGLLCAGVNINDITNTVFQTGEIVKTTDPMHATLSDAINIQLPYNLERLLFYITEGNHQLVHDWYQELETSNVRRTQLGADWLVKLQTEFRSARITDELLCTTIRETLATYKYWADPHTGVAFAAANQLLLGSGGESSGGSGAGVALLATASPCKFQEAMTVAVGAEKWKEYFSQHFPALGQTILCKKEKAPVEYTAQEGRSLLENQVEWERMARKLIDSLNKVMC